MVGVTGCEGFIECLIDRLERDVSTSCTRALADTLRLPWLVVSHLRVP